MSARVEKRLGVVGLPQAARRYLEVLGDFPELVPYALVIDEEVSPPEPLHSARRFASVEDMIRYRSLPDIALVCTPPAEHLADGEALLRAGVDLLILAPLATCFDDAERLVDCAERSGRELTTAGPGRLSPALLAARMALDEGVLGDLHHVAATLSEKRDPRASWRGDPTRSGGGVWMQLGPEAIDTVETLAGPIERIRMLSLEERQGAGVEDEVEVECDHGGERRSRIRLSWNEERPDPVAHCFGDLGELLVGRSQTVLRREAGDEVCGAGDERRAACREQLSEHLRRRCSLHPPLDTGPVTVAWIEAAYHSLRDQRWQC